MRPPAPREGPLPHFKVMADYGCWPLWHDYTDIGNVDPDALPITPGLRDDLLRWAERFDQTLNDDDPASSGFETLAAEGLFQRDGRSLTQRLAAELAETAVIRYHHDAPDLALRLAPADRVLVVDGPTYDRKHRKRNAVLAAVRDPKKNRSLLEALQFVPGGEHPALMTPGSPTIVALNGRTPLAALTCIRSRYIRCHEHWQGDAPLAQPGDLETWLTHNGIPGPSPSGRP